MIFDKIKIIIQCIVGYCYKYTCAAYDCFCAPGSQILSILVCFSNILLQWFSYNLLFWMPIARFLKETDIFAKSVPNSEHTDLSTLLTSRVISARDLTALTVSGWRNDCRLKLSRRRLSEAQHTGVSYHKTRRKAGYGRGTSYIWNHAVVFG